MVTMRTIGEGALIGGAFIVGCALTPLGMPAAIIKKSYDKLKEVGYKCLLYSLNKEKNKIDVTPIELLPISSIVKGSKIDGKIHRIKEKIINNQNEKNNTYYINIAFPCLSLPMKTFDYLSELRNKPHNDKHFNSDNNNYINLDSFSKSKED